MSLKLFLLVFMISLTAMAEVDYIDVRDSLSKDPKKTVVVIGCTDGTVNLIPIDKNDRNAGKKINITLLCK